jgi:D-inositol-3-phosphate glycosyltransferase
MSTRPERPPVRVAVVSLHTSPLDPPGSGDSGGMNVEIRAVAERLSERGVAVDVFTRCSGSPGVEWIAPLARVVKVQSGPCAPVPKGSLTDLVDGFAESVVEAATERYDVVHAHYWLSGPAAARVAERWDVPFVASFHTLAEVKNRALAEGDVPEQLSRLAGERQTVRLARRLVAPTVTEARNLVELYDADAERIRIVPPGVDHDLFFPRAGSRRRLGLGDGPLVLFAGRLQPLKGPDVALRAFAEARRGSGELKDARLLVVGGPSGERGEATEAELRTLAAEEGVADAVRFLGPRPHAELPWLYAAADVLVMPSRSESFGLAALEAQACGLPVVASDVGGLRHAVVDGESGLLVRDVDGAAAALRRLLTDDGERARLGRGARLHAGGFTWDRTADGLLDVYGELASEAVPAAAS